MSCLFLISCAATNNTKVLSSKALSKGHTGTTELGTTEKNTNDIPGPVVSLPYLPQPKPAVMRETYTVVVNEVPVKELLFALARDAGLNVDIHPGIKGMVTLNAINQNLPQILQRLSQQVDLRFRINGKNLVISPDIPYVRTYEVDYVNLSRDSVSETSVATEISTTGGSIDNTAAVGGGQSGNKSNTRVINRSKNNFWKLLADNIALLLDESLLGTPIKNKKYNDRVVVNPMGGVVSVRASEREHMRIQAFLDKLMASVRRQVLIEATIVEVALDDRYQAGVDWQRLSDDNGLGNNGASYRSLTTDGNYNTSPVFSVTYNNSDRNIFAAIKALETFGETRVLSSPKIMAINNQTALLKVVDETVYFTVEREFVEATESSAARESFSSEIHTVPVGLVMSVIPQITVNDSVTMNVRPTISRITGFKIDPAPRLAGASFDNLIPEIQVREMESFLRVDSGQTVVLGGLMQNRNNQDESGVPFFSDLPLIGGLFGHRDEQQGKTELVIFLKPTVVRNGSLDRDFRKFRRFLPDLAYTPDASINAHHEIAMKNID